MLVFIILEIKNLKDNKPISCQYSISIPTKNVKKT